MEGIKLMAKHGQVVLLYMPINWTIGLYDIIWVVCKGIIWKINSACLYGSICRWICYMGDVWHIMSGEIHDTP